MTNNINDLKKIIGNKIPLKVNNINKVKEEIKSVELKKEDEVKIDAFKISDIVRQIQDIFSKIDNCLSLSTYLEK